MHEVLFVILIRRVAFVIGGRFCALRTSVHSRVLLLLEPADAELY